MKACYYSVAPAPTVGITPETQEELDCINATLSKMVDKIHDLELKMELNSKQLNTDITTLRAMIIAAKLDERDHLSRSEVQRILNGCHHNYALKVMQKATKLYSEISLQKTLSNKWVLRRQ